MQTVKKAKKYPMYELSTIVNITQKARKVGKYFDKPVFANLISQSGQGSVNSGTFNHKLSSLKHFGLIEVQRGQIVFLESAEDINLKDMFLFPESFRELYNTIEKGTTVPIIHLLKIAQNQIGISGTGVARFTKNFIRSGISAKLIKYNPENREEIILLEKEGRVRRKKKENLIETASECGQKAQIVLSEGKATIIVPENLSEQDKTRLKAQIDIF